jgi:predicted DCC family thiol-disulfide oxidoreductase YuxK
MHDNVRAMTLVATLLYDSECGFCRWTVARVLRRDTNHQICPVAIQSLQGNELLANIPPEERLASWHLARDDGRVFSGAEALPALLELLHHPGQARLIDHASGLVGPTYRGVASRRRAFGPLISRAAQRRADELIAQRSRDSDANAGLEAAADSAESSAPAQSDAPPLPAVPEPAALPPVVSAERASEPPPPEREPAPNAQTEPLAAAPESPPESAAVGTSWQQRVEASAIGRGLLTTLIVITLIALVADNMPESELKAKLLRPAQPYLNVFGLDQNWALFAPDPRKVSLDIWAVVAFEDGKTVRWHPPNNGPLIGTYRDYRWRKWEEGITGRQNSVLWRPAALWAAGRSARSGHFVTRVSLVERFTPNQPPGVHPEVGPASDHVFYVLNVQGRGGRP